MVQGEIGTYKVAYLKAGEAGVLYSKMFDKIEPALDFAHKAKSRWLLFQRSGSDSENYAWKILPYGAYKSYDNLIWVDSIRYVFIVAGLILAVWLISKMFNKVGAIPGVR